MRLSIESPTHETLPLEVEELDLMYFGNSGELDRLWWLGSGFKLAAAQSIMIIGIIPSYQTINDVAPPLKSNYLRVLDKR